MFPTSWQSGTEECNPASLGIAAGGYSIHTKLPLNT